MPHPMLSDSPTLEQYLQAARQEWFEALHTFLLEKPTALHKLLGCFDFLEYNLRLNDYQGCRFINLLPEVANQHEPLRHVRA